MLKNVAGQTWRVFAFNLTTNEPVLNDEANITAKLKKDAGTYVATNDINPDPIGIGYYEFNLTQAESNADNHELLPTSASENVQVISAKNPATITTSGYTPFG